MLFEVRVLATRPLAVLGLLAALLFGKAALVAVSAFLLRLPLRSTLLAALALAQVGEFGFVLGRGQAPLKGPPPPLLDLLHLGTQILPPLLHRPVADIRGTELFLQHRIGTRFKY